MISEPGFGGTDSTISKSQPTLSLFFQTKYQQVQDALGEVQKQLEEAQQRIQGANLEEKPAGGGQLADGTPSCLVCLFKGMCGAHVSHSRRVCNGQ